MDSDRSGRKEPQMTEIEEELQKEINMQKLSPEERQIREAYIKLIEQTQIDNMIKIDFMCCLVQMLRSTEADEPIHAMEEFELHKAVYTNYNNFLTFKEVLFCLKKLEDMKLILNTRRISYWLKTEVARQQELEEEQEEQEQEEALQKWKEANKNKLFTFGDFFEYERLKEEKEKLEKKHEYLDSQRKYNEVAFDFLSWDNRKGIPEDLKQTLYKTIKQKRRYLKVLDNEENKELLELMEIIADTQKKRR